MVSTLAKAATPKEPGYTPSTPALCAPLRKRAINYPTLLIIWLSQSHVDCGCTVVLGGSPCSINIFHTQNGVAFHNHDITIPMLSKLSNNLPKAFDKQG
jgi:hypothetical protein